MARLDWNLGENRKTIIPGLTPEEQKNIDAEIDGANANAFAVPNGAPQVQPKGLTPWEQTMASINSRADNLRLREQQLRTAGNDANRQARMRRLEGMLATEGGRYSPIQLRQTREELDRLQGGGVPGLRAHELAVADKGIEQERVKAWGLANQGGVAAGIKAGVERDASRAQHGYFDENGNFVPGSTVRAAEATGLSRTELENMRSENRMAHIVAQENGRDRRQQKDLAFKEMELNNNNEQKGYDRDAKKAEAEERTQRIRKRQAQQDAMREQKDFEAFDQKVGTMNIDLPPEQEEEYKALKTPEERKAWWKSHFGRGDQQTQGGSPKIPGYSPERIAELQKRGYKWNGSDWVK